MTRGLENRPVNAFRLNGPSCVEKGCIELFQTACIHLYAPEVSMLNFQRRDMVFCCASLGCSSREIRMMFG